MSLADVGFFHETAFYGSDDDFLSIVVPFLEGGAATGEPTLVTLADRNASLVRHALPSADGITFIPGDHQYDRPAASIRVYRERFADLVAQGATRIRVVGDVPHPGVGAPWDGWARYEAAVNHAFEEFPVWGLCPYDTRITPEAVLDEVVRTHRHVATLDGDHVPNDRYEDPAQFLLTRPAPAPEPLEQTRPAIERWDPSAADARQAVGSLLAGLPPTEIDKLVVSVSEVVTNAQRHGLPPVHLRGWRNDGRVIVTVHDCGSGITEPFAGLVRPERDVGGLGLWIAFQLCSEVSLLRGDGGFGVRLVLDTATF